MKKIIIALAATTAFAGATPALAQYGGGNYQLRSDQLQEQLQDGVRSGAITRSEAMPLRQQLRQLMQLERQYSYGGISGRERADLQMRINRLRQQIRFAARNGDGRYDRDDRYGDRDDRYGNDGYGRGGYSARTATDRDGDGYDDRDRNRDRWIDERERAAGGSYGTRGGYGARSATDQNGDGYDDRDYNRDGRIDDRELRNGGSYGGSSARTATDRDGDGFDDRDLNRDRRIDDAELRAAEGRNPY